MFRMKSAVSALLIAIMSIALSGCLYPDDQLEQNQRPAKDAILNVQTVIDQYQKDTGLLPIQNSKPDTPLYEKYLVDFDKLQRMKYISDIPTTAYEKGGSYYYLIIDEEKDPTIKLMNLVIYQRINDVQIALKNYADKNGGKLPVGESVYPGFKRIDYKKLGTSEPDIRSVFSGQTLGTMMDAEGKVYVDYGIDITQALTKLEGAKPGPEQDLRELLVESSDFVPVKSAAYYLVDGEPQAVINE
ncbi:hypothetical protein [Paenibacillus spongiae]|uniref:Uncharacterized protein n=1 Tax=Paenibacillus spongiae TaxID=2909671 RepID=A0ABY5SI44_9BACL|nr:hypothetical protein [Paenibacillus spongiae]UVI32382.1 hypothetical protein L1F29_11420 [Paenibacillus spongiae]